MKKIPSLIFYLLVTSIAHGQKTLVKNDSLQIKGTPVLVKPTTDLNVKSNVSNQNPVTIVNNSNLKTTSVILNAPIQGKDVRIAINSINDISTSTQNKYVVHYTIMNGGTENFHTGYTRLRSYLYTNSGTRIPTNGDTLFMHNPQQTLTSGNATSGVLTIYSNFLYTNGSYKVMVMADAENLVAEANETNNSAEKSVSAHVPPPATGTVTDIDGNVYHTIQIGTQTWMVENLKTSKLNDGTPLVNPKQVLINNNYFGMSATTLGNGWGVNMLTGVGGTYALKANNPAWCYYNDDAANNATYGKLYNLFAVNTGKLAPAGWHVATDADWATLINYVKPNSDKNLKSTTGWNNNTGNINITGFTALPAGYIVETTNQYSGARSFQFKNAGTGTVFWSVTNAPSLGKGQSLDGGILTGLSPTAGYSIRCVKN